MSRVPLIISPLLLAVVAIPASACEFEPQQDAQAYVVHVATLHAVQGCFGRANDEAEITLRVRADLEAMDAPMRTVGEVTAVRDQALSTLAAVDLSLDSAAGAAPPLWRQSLEFLQQRLSTGTAQVAALDARVTAGYWDYDDLTYFDGQLDLKPMIRSSCDGEFTPSCQTGLESAATLLRHAELAGSVLRKVVAERALVPRHERVAALDAQWTDYFERGRSQYVWELALNSRLYQRNVRDDELAPPPSAQWILLHPGVAVELADEGPGGHTELNAVGVIELFGFNRWNGLGPMVRWPLGVSAITTVSPESRGDRFGWGLVVHVNNRYSIGTARRDLGAGRETTWLLSIDLGRLFLATREETRSTFRFE